jgi:hypothetical protein
MAAFHLRRFLTIATAAAAIFISGCGKDSDGIARVAAIGPDPKLVETVTAPLTPGEALVRASMAQGLVRFDERGQVVPGLAERWNVSDDGLSYIFRLQTGDWPDGRKIRADDIARILARQLRPASTNPLKDTLGAVSEVVAMTDRVIEIRLSAPRPNLLQLLAQPEFGLVRASVGTSRDRSTTRSCSSPTAFGSPMPRIRWKWFRSAAATPNRWLPILPREISTWCSAGPSATFPTPCAPRCRAARFVSIPLRACSGYCRPGAAKSWRTRMFEGC